MFLKITKPCQCPPGFCHEATMITTACLRFIGCNLVNLKALLWRHNGCDGVSNHQPHNCLLNCSFRRRSQKTSKLRVTGLCGGNSPVTGEFPAQIASNAENVSMWWRHHGYVQSFWMHVTFQSLTDCGRVTPKCVSNLTIIDLHADHGLSPVRCPAIIRTSARILLIRTLGTNFSEILSEIRTFSLKKLHGKKSFVKRRPFCLCLNMFKQTGSPMLCFDVV